MQAMNIKTRPATLLQRLPGGTALRRITPPVGVALVGLVLFVLAILAGVAVADLVPQESEQILAAPFRW
jgi:hypothetical protein